MGPRGNDDGCQLVGLALKVMLPVLNSSGFVLG